MEECQLSMNEGSDFKSSLPPQKERSNLSGDESIEPLGKAWLQGCRDAGGATGAIKNSSTCGTGPQDYGLGKDFGGRRKGRGPIGKL